MPCCNGLNSFLAVPVPVVNGDGPLLPVGQLAAKKTFYLNGAWKGTYVLLGSHDGIDFVPVDGGKFDGGGNPQQARVDIDAMLAFVRVRRDADSLAVAAIASQLTCACSTTPPPPFAPKGEEAPKLSAKKDSKSVETSKPARLPKAASKIAFKKPMAIYHKGPGVKKIALDEADENARKAKGASQAETVRAAEASEAAKSAPKQHPDVVVTHSPKGKKSR